jgi:hypothetical protein
MTRAEAERHAAQLQIEHPEHATHRFFARAAKGGDWEVAKVHMPTQLRPQRLTPTIEAKPRPWPADDPRTGHERRAPGFPGGVG